MTTKTDRAAVRRLVDALPEAELGAARRYLQYLRDHRDPVLRAFLDAPLDDEPETEDERAAVGEAKRDLIAGRVVSHRSAKRRLLGRA